MRLSGPVPAATSIPSGWSDKIPFCGTACAAGEMAAETQARRFFVSGRVQGVGYRYFAANVAEQLGIAGYVRNLPDGRVEAYAIGTVDQLCDFAEELRRGPALAGVTDVSEVQAEILPDYRSRFSVAFT